MLETIGKASRDGVAMANLDFILCLLALICFIAATFGVKTDRVNLVAAGVSLWMFSILV